MSTTQVADVANTVPALAVKNLVKTYGTVGALNGVNLAASPGKVHCLLGDNGAGKSTLIKILSGVTQPSAGELSAAGRPIKFNSPREALIQGVATVYQDLAVIPMMSVFRNFFLGRELSRGWGPLSRFDTHRAKEITITEMAKMGINIRCPNQPAGTLSGGERQSLAITRALYFGANVLILDEPTSALGVTQTTRVLQVIHQARSRGIAVIFITHNVRHAYAVGDDFTVLRQGKSLGTQSKSALTINELQTQMAGGQALEGLPEALSLSIV
jgi:simple sugar transport system ATP-binding protein